MGLIKSFSGSRGGFSKKPLAAGGIRGEYRWKGGGGGSGGEGVPKPPRLPPLGGCEGGTKYSAFKF